MTPPRPSWRSNCAGCPASSWWRATTVTLDHLDIAADERLLVTGTNGAGKSTLLWLLADRLEARGEVRRRRDLRVGLLAQDTVFDRLDRTPRETYELALGAERAECVPLRSLGLIDVRDLDGRVGNCPSASRRLALALLVANPPELLLLDEPTNHLSPRLSDELEEALGTTSGAVVVASHDRWLRSPLEGPRAAPVNRRRTFRGRIH